MSKLWEKLFIRFDDCIRQEKKRLRNLYPYNAIINYMYVTKQEFYTLGYYDIVLNKIVVESITFLMKYDRTIQFYFCVPILVIDRFFKNQNNISDFFVSLSQKCDCL